MTFMTIYAVGLKGKQMILVYWALGLFFVGALAGLIMAVRAFGGLRIPASLAGFHGLMGASGLMLLLAISLSGTVREINSELVLVILTAAALGGFYLVSFHIRGKELPKPVIVVHALTAIAGVTVLAWIVIERLIQICVG